MIIFVIIAAIAFVVTFTFVVCYDFGPTKSQVSEHAYSYGHQFNPIVAVKNRLPKPPLGYAWEIYITDSQKDVSTLHKNRHFGQLLVLHLYDLNMSKVVEQTAVSITWHHDHENTFVAHYNRFGQYGTAKKSAYKQIVFPMQAWANDIAQKYSPNEQQGYEMIT